MVCVMDREFYEAFSKSLCAFLECDDDSQEIIHDMAGVVNDPEATLAEQQAAIRTIAEALFPSGQDG